MFHSLPDAPNLEQLRKQAKDLVKAHRLQDANACAALRRLQPFAQASDEQILAARVSLGDAQHALAKMYGFDSWADLKRHVEKVTKTAAHQQVRRQGGRVWIEGVPELRWGQPCGCTFAGAMSAALSVTSRPVSYHDIMGYAGLAFRVRWYRRFDQPDWCPSSPVGEFDDEIRMVSRIVGWPMHLESEMGKAENDPHMERFATAIKESIDAGLPVVGYPDKDLNVAVAYGYEETDSDAVFLWNAYNRSELRVSAKKVGPWLLFLTDRVQPLEPMTALRKALTTPNWRRSRMNANRPNQDASYLYGRGAIEQWRKDIGQADEFSPEQRSKLFFVSYWCFDSLIDARRAASRFLNEQAGKMDDEARSALAETARIYGNLAQLGAAVCFQEKAAFWGPGTGKTLEDWTPEIRKREQEILAEIEAMDSQAASQIDKALAAMQ